MRKQHGFTLIELIIVIVILGILAVTAAPKFLNFGSDARAATVQGLAGALKSASNLVYAKAVIAGVEKTESDSLLLSDNGSPVPIRFGYLDTQPSLINAFNEALELTDGEWDTSFNLASGTDVRLSPAGLNPQPASGPPSLANISRCYVQYSPAATLGATPLITVNTADCN